MTELKINKNLDAETTYLLLREEVEKTKLEIKLEITNLEMRIEKAISKLVIQITVIICATHGASVLLEQVLK